MASTPDDHDLDQLIEIELRGLRYFVAPRYHYHYVENEYERFSTRYWERYIAPGDVVADVGAHYGYYSLLAGRSARDGRVYAFEPVPTNYAVLQRNISANHLGSIQPHEIALSSERGRSSFNMTGASDSGGFYEHPLAKRKRTIDVATDTLEHAIDGARLDWLKIDTEGHELSVLEGAENLIRDNPQLRMLVEFNPACLRKARREPEELLDYIDHLGFEAFVLDEIRCQAVRMSHRPELWSELMSGREYANILAIHRSRTASVLMLSHTSNQAGAEDALFDLAIGLQRRGMVCHVVAPTTGPLLDKLAEGAVGTTVVPSEWWAQGVDHTDGSEAMGLGTQAVGAIVELARQLGVNRMVTNTLVVPAAAFAAAELDLPHLLMVHEFGDLDQRLRFSLGYAQSLRLLGHLSDAVVANSQAVASHIEGFIPAEKMHVVHNFVGLKDQPVHAESLFGADIGLKLTIVGRVTDSKGQLDAARAILELGNRGITDVQLLIVGQPEEARYHQMLLSFIADHDLTPRVVFAGYQANPYPMMTDADVVLVCSRAEAFGRATVEAMALGRPVIGANSGATPELVADGKVGLLYRQGDWMDLASKIEEIYRGGPELRSALGAAAREVALSGFSEELYAGTIYRQLMDLGTQEDPVRALFRLTLELITRDLANRVVALATANSDLRQQVDEFRGRYDNQQQHLREIEESRAWRVVRFLHRVWDGLRLRR